MIDTMLAAAAPTPAWLYRRTYASLRVRGRLADGTILDPQEYQIGSEIYAICERDALALGGLIALSHCTVLVAFGRDGDWASALLAKLGFGLVRGASGRGGAEALTALVDVLAAPDARVAIVVDGPLGPSGHAKRGIALCAQRTGRPIRALAAAARPALVFRKAWSQIFLPLPFSRLVITCDDPLTVPADASTDTVNEVSRHLSNRLALMRRCAEDELRDWSADEASGLAKRASWHVGAPRRSPVTHALSAQTAQQRRTGEA